MTLGEAKRKTVEILDEFSDSGAMVEDTAHEMRMNLFFDIAQKEMSKIKRIVRLWHPEADESGECILPKGFMAVKRIWYKGRLSGKGRFAAGKYIPDSTRDVKDTVIEYFSLPEDITAMTPDTYEFEIAPDAQECMPYFVAAQLVLSDVSADFRPYMNMFETMVMNLHTREADGVVINKIF